MDFETKDLTATMLDMDPVSTPLGDLAASTGMINLNTTEDTVVWLERKQGTIEMVDSAARGAPGAKIGDTERDAVPFELLSYPLSEPVNVDQVRGKRRFGTVNEMETFDEKVNEKLAIGNQRYDLTEEIQRIAMLRGQQVKKDGTVKRDYFDIFGLTKQTFNFGLDTGSTEILAEARMATRRITDKLNGKTVRGFVALTGATAFDMLVTHKTYKETKLATPQAAELLSATNMAKVGNITFMEYTFRPNGLEMIGEHEILLFPVGVDGMFLGRFGPATWEIDAPQPRYAKQIPHPKGTGVDIEMESHMLYINALPECVLHADARTTTP